MHSTQFKPHSEFLESEISVKQGGGMHKVRRHVNYKLHVARSLACPLFPILFLDTFYRGTHFVPNVVSRYFLLSCITYLCHFF